MDNGDQKTLFCALGIDGNVYVYLAYFKDSKVWDNLFLVQHLQHPQDKEQKMIAFSNPFPFCDEKEQYDALTSPYIIATYEASPNMQALFAQAMEQRRVARSGGIEIVRPGQPGVPSIHELKKGNRRKQ